MRYIFLFILLVGSCTSPEALQEGEFILNPLGKTPLSGEYRLKASMNTPITIHVKGKTPEMDIIHTAVFGTKNIPIHGLYPNYTNIVILSSGDISVTNTIVTKSVPVKKAVVKIDKLKESDPKNQDFYFSDPIMAESKKGGDRHIIIAHDRTGEVRYVGYHNKLHYMYPTNDQIVFRNNNGILDLLGNVLVPYQGTVKDLHVHHDSFQKGDKHVVLVNSHWGIEDRLVELDDKGEILRDVDFGQLFRDIVKKPEEIAILNKIIFDEKNKYKDKNGKQRPIDWSHANSMVYDEKNDILYVSKRNQAVIAIDYSDWKLIWWMADNTWDSIHRGVPNRGYNFIRIPSLDAYRVKGDALTTGPENQHALFLFANGNLGMFDNGGDDKKNPSRYVEYSIEKKGSEWVAILEREYKDPNLYSHITSDVDLLANGNILVAWGRPSTLKEINLANEVVFEMNVFQHDFFYRAEKMPFYPYMNKRKKYSLDADEITGY